MVRNGTQSYVLAAAFVVLVTSQFFGLVGCAPSSFIKTSTVNWNTVELRDDLQYNEAWKIVTDTIAQKFDIEVLEQDAGYLRTGWYYGWTGSIDEDYRVRALVKFAQDRKSLQVRSEAEYRGRGGWVLGEDARLTSLLKTDLMGKIGRVTR